MSNKTLKKYFSSIDQISQGNIINSWHVSQITDALSGLDKYNIKILGSLEIDGILTLKNTPAGNGVKYKILGLDSSNNTVKLFNSEDIINSFSIEPLKRDIINRTVWNPGKGGIDSNTIFGKDSFLLNITGVGNAVYGPNNLTKSNTAYNNYIFGLGNLINSLNPYFTIAIGAQVLPDYEGHDSIGIGIQTLNKNKLGVNNVSIGNKSSFNSLGSKLTILGDQANIYDINGNNRINIGYRSGKYIGDNFLEIHSYMTDDINEQPLILGKFDERWLKIHGNLRLDLIHTSLLNPGTDAPFQLVFDSQGKSYIINRSYTKFETDDLLTNYYNKTQINNFFQGITPILGYNKTKWDEAYGWGDHRDEGYLKQETQTTIDQPVLTGSILTIKYTGENQIQQTKNVDLSELVISGRDKHYTHDQTTPSDIWVVNHNLNKKPSHTITDSNGSEVEGMVEHIDKNTIKITFNSPFSGFLELN